MYSKLWVKHVIFLLYFLNLSIQGLDTAQHLPMFSPSCLGGKSVLPVTMLSERPKFSHMHLEAIYLALFFPSLPGNYLFERLIMKL